MQFLVYKFDKQNCYARLADKIVLDIYLINTIFQKININLRLQN